MGPGCQRNCQHVPGRGHFEFSGFEISALSAPYRRRGYGGDPRAVSGDAVGAGRDRGQCRAQRIGIAPALALRSVAT